jgi:hypothetical protein
MRKQTAAPPPVSEVELHLVARPPATEKDVEEQAEFASAPELGVSRKSREIKPLPLVLSVLGLALLLLIPMLLLLQRLQS